MPIADCIIIETNEVQEVMTIIKIAKYLQRL